MGRPYRCDRCGPHVVFLTGLGVYFLLRRAVRHSDDAPDEALDECLVGCGTPRTAAPT